MFHKFEAVAVVVVVIVGIQIDVLGFSNKVVVIVGMGKCFFVRAGIAGRIGSWGWMFWFFINLHLGVSLAMFDQTEGIRRNYRRQIYHNP